MTAVREAGMVTERRAVWTKMTTVSLCLSRCNGVTCRWPLGDTLLCTHQDAHVTPP